MLFDRRFKVNIAQTTLVQVLNIASFVILLVLVLPRFITKEELGIYVTFRAMVNTLFPLYTCALDIAQARYLGVHAGNPTEQRRITATVIRSFLGIAIISTGIMLAIRPVLQERFFDGNPSFFWAILAALIFTGMYRISYTYFQGHKQMEKANLLQFLIFVVGNSLLACGVWLGWIQGLDRIITIVALLPGLAVVPFFIILLRNRARRFHFRSVLLYALPRLPHLFFTGLLMSGAVILAKYFYSAELAGDFGIAVRFFQMVATMAYAFNMVLLPGVSELWGKGRLKELSASLKQYADLVLWAGTACVFGFFVFGPLAIQLLLPVQYEPGIPILKIMAVGALPYVFHIMFRSTIHGVDERPVQVFIDLIQISVLFSTFFLLRHSSGVQPFITIAVAITATYYAAGTASYLYITRRLKFHADYAAWLLHGLLIAILLMASGLTPVTAICAFVLLELFLLHRKWKAYRTSV